MSEGVKVCLVSFGESLVTILSHWSSGIGVTGALATH